LCVAAIGGFFAAGVPLLAAAVSDALSDDPCANATGEVGKALGVAAGSVVAAAAVVGTAVAAVSAAPAVAAFGVTNADKVPGIAEAAADILSSGPSSTPFGAAVQSIREGIPAAARLGESIADRQ